MEAMPVEQLPPQTGEILVCEKVCKDCKGFLEKARKMSLETLPEIDENKEDIRDMSKDVLSVSEKLANILRSHGIDMCTMLYYSSPADYTKPPVTTVTINAVKKEAEFECALFKACNMKTGEMPEEARNYDGTLRNYDLVCILHPSKYLDKLVCRFMEKMAISLTGCKEGCRLHIPERMHKTMKANRISSCKLYFLEPKADIRKLMADGTLIMAEPNLNMEDLEQQCKNHEEGVLAKISIFDVADALTFTWTRFQDEKIYFPDAVQMCMRNLKELIHFVHPPKIIDHKKLLEEYEAEMVVTEDGRIVHPAEEHERLYGPTYGPDDEAFKEEYYTGENFVSARMEWYTKN